MKKSFSLLEIIIVILVISIISSYIISKSTNTINFANQSKIKSEISLIRSSIVKFSTKQILLDQDYIVSLDNANIDQSDSFLFENILDDPLLSTSMEDKEISKWIKISQNSYKIYLDQNIFLEFEFDNNDFICISDVELCKEFEWIFMNWLF